MNSNNVYLSFVEAVRASQYVYETDLDVLNTASLVLDMEREIQE